MQRACDSCGKMYEAKRPASRFCETNCRVRYANGHQAVPTSIKAPVVMSSTLESSSAAELAAVGRLDTAVGQLALILARRIDSGQDTGAGLASLSRQLRDTLAAAMANGVEMANPVDRLRDELAARRSGS